MTEGELKREEEASLEVHDKYIDVQVLIAGEVETMGWRERRECRVPRGPFDAEEDIRFFADRPQLFVGIRPGQFVVFGPEVRHAPMIGRGRIKNGGRKGDEIGALCRGRKTQKEIETKQGRCQ